MQELSDRDRRILSSEGPPQQRLERCIHAAMAYLFTPYRLATTPKEANAVVTRAVAKYRPLWHAWGTTYEAIFRDAGAALILSPFCTTPAGGGKK